MTEQNKTLNTGLLRTASAEEKAQPRQAPRVVMESMTMRKITGESAATVGRMPSPEYITVTIDHPEATLVSSAGTRSATLRGSTYFIGDQTIEKESSASTYIQKEQLATAKPETQEEKKRRIVGKSLVINGNRIRNSQLEMGKRLAP
ncbi:MAG: hypothetical protein ACHQX1_01985 [Candidatus Micrarchaeales archaeon]